MAYKDATSPAIKAAAVTPSDVTVLDPPTKALYIGGAGNVSVVLVDDTVAVVFTAMAAGQILPACVKKVMSTGTTATSIVAMY